MVAIALGLAVLGLLLWAARAFSRASVASVKALGAWVLALAGLSLTALLFLTGKGGLAMGGLVFAGPALLNWWRGHAAPGLGGKLGGGQGGRQAGARAPGPMRREEALEVLGLADPVSETDIREAWVRLMQAVHPDHGGSDWLAARINQARDVLLRK